ncbi:MAG: hypothetical protein D6773_14020, partial [Alphaproteobacteria bacterium]
MSMSDERAGVEKESSAAQGAQSEQPNSLPGLAAFGAMQTYSPTTGAASAQAPQAAGEPVTGEVPAQPVSGPGHEPVEGAAGATLAEQSGIDGAELPGGDAALDPYAEAVHEAGAGAGELASPLANGGDSYPGDGQAGAAVEPDAGYYAADSAGQPGDASAELMQQALQQDDLAQLYQQAAENGQDIPAEGYGQPEHDPYAYASGLDGAGEQPPLSADPQGTGALQAFEAHYDRQPEINLGDSVAGHEAEQPFFHEPGQGDADFLAGEEYPEETMPVPKEKKSRKALMLASGLIGALALGGAVAFAYKTGGGSAKLVSGEAPPLIQADNRPVKTRPEQPGGREFPHKNKRIYDRLEGEKKPEVERIVPRQEQVVSLPAATPASGSEPTAAT